MREIDRNCSRVRPFYVAHAMMALVARAAPSTRCPAPRQAAPRPRGFVTLPFCKALLAFACGDYVRCVESLKRVHHIAHRRGGSLAQCDLIHLTYTEAALRARKASLARALYRLGGNNYLWHSRILVAVNYKSQLAVEPDVFDESHLV